MSDVASDKAARLAALARYTTLDAPPDPALDEIGRTAAALFDAPIALINLIKADRQWFMSAFGMPPGTPDRDIAFCTQAMRAPERVTVVEDATLDERFRDDPLVTGAPGVRFYAGKPLVTPDGIALGTLCVIGPAPRQADDSQQRVLARLAGLVMTLLEERRDSRLAALVRAVEQAARHGVLITDATLPDNPITHVNHAFERMTGYSKSELLGRNCRILQGPDTDPHTVAQLRTAIAEERPRTVLIRNYRKDGTPFWNELTVSPVKDGAGRTLNYVGVQVDVSDKLLAAERAEALAAATAAEQRARASRDQLAEVVELTSNEIYVFDARSFRILDANRAARANLGYSLDEIRQLAAWDCVAGMSRRRIEGLGELLRGGERESLVAKGAHRRKDGSTYPVSSHLQLMATRTPPVYVAIVQDLTERRRQEDSKRLRERAIEAVDVGVSIIDAHGEGYPFVYVNRALCDMTGYAREELIGRSARMLQGGNRRQDGHRRIDAALANGESVQVLLESTCKDGTHYTDEVSLSPVLDRDGALRHYIGINRDVTERLDTEQRLHQSQKNEAIAQLAGGIAHDFNNLLSVIDGNLELLATALEDARHREWLDEARNAARMGARSTRRLLRFAQQGVLDPEVLDPNDSVGAATELLGATVGESINLTTRLASAPWRVHADASGLESAIVNLVINARDAMPRGGRIVVESRNVSVANDEDAHRDGVPPGDYVRLSVTDNGTGMTPEVRSRVFEPFFTTKAQSKGTGLGLASTHGFVKQSGGHIVLRSKPGRGSVFHLYLPRHRTPVESSPSTQPAPTGEPAQKHGRVLVVEDNDMVRRVTVRRLRALGLDTAAAANGPQAVSLLEDDPAFDLVLSDIVMDGGMSGHDLAHWVQQHAPHCRILLTSGFDDGAAQRRESPQADALRVLQKPYDLAELRAAVERELQDA